MAQALPSSPYVAKKDKRNDRIEGVDGQNATESSEGGGLALTAAPTSSKSVTNNLDKSTKTSSCVRAEKIQDGLEKTISIEAKQKIEHILNEVNQLPDVEKLLLYLKLPTGTSIAYPKDGGGINTGVMASSNRLEQMQAITWIRSHMEEHADTSLPKQEVYDDYKMYCESHGYKFLSQGDFGKVMKCVFPNVKPRRLGQRGQSKHCYGGLRKKVKVKAPVLPEVNVDTQNDLNEELCCTDELLDASCTVVCEWAERLLNQSFSGSMKQLAEHLVSHTFVNSRSVAAFTVLAAMQNVELPSSKQKIAGTTNNDQRHRETQLQLQRKLHERELVREQKRQLERQQAEHLKDGDESDGVADTRNDKLIKSQPTTPQKLILPKTLSTSGAVVTAPGPGTIKAIQNQAPPILLLQAQPNQQPLNQQVLILSPANQNRTQTTTLFTQNSASNPGLTSNQTRNSSNIPVHQVVLGGATGKTIKQKLQEKTACSKEAQPVTTSAPNSTVLKTLLHDNELVTSVSNALTCTESAPLKSYALTNHSKNGSCAEAPTETVLLNSPTSTTPTTQPIIISPAVGSDGSQVSFKPAYKTVSSLLKEQRGFALQPENKTSYANDRRPVSELLKESRKFQQTLGMSPNPLVGSLSPTPANSNGPLVPPNISPSTLMIANNPRPILTAALLVSTETLTATTDKAGIKTMAVTNSSPLMAAMTSVPRIQTATAENGTGIKRELPQQHFNAKRALLSSDLECRADILHSGNQAIKREENASERVNVSSVEQDALLDYMDNEPVPELADINPSIDSFVSSAERQPVSTQVIQGTSQQTLLGQHERPGLISQYSNVFNAPDAFLRKDVLLSEAAKPHVIPPTLKVNVLPGATAAPQSNAHSQENKVAIFIEYLNSPEVQARLAKQGLTPHQALVYLVSKAKEKNQAKAQPVAVETGNLSSAGSMRSGASSPTSVVNSMPQSPASLMSPGSTIGASCSASSTPGIMSPVQPEFQTGPLPVPLYSGAPVQESVVKPMVTTAPFVPQNTGSINIGMTPNSFQASGRQGSHFVPYNGVGTVMGQNSGLIEALTASPQGAKKSSHMSAILKEKLAEKLKKGSICGKAGGQFAPASSIKPVKRGGKGNKGKGKIRQRHHSAQSALNSRQSVNQQGLTPLLNSPQTQCQATPASSALVTLQRRVSADLANQNTPLASTDTLGPESPFSPEMQDIFGTPNAVGPAASTSGMFRSQSVPIQDTFYGGSDNQELFQQNNGSELMDIMAGGSEEMSNLLQEKLNEDTTGQRGIQASNQAAESYTARRNLSQMLEVAPQQAPSLSNQILLDFEDSQNTVLNYPRKGDMMLGSFVASMPPISNNARPDFSAAGLADVQISSASSLETPMNGPESILNDLYDSQAETMQSTDLLAQWDMPQMA